MRKPPAPRMNLGLSNFAAATRAFAGSALRKSRCTPSQPADLSAGSETRRAAPASSQSGRQALTRARAASSSRCEVGANTQAMSPPDSASPRRFAASAGASPAGSIRYRRGESSSSDMRGSCSRLIRGLLKSRRIGRKRGLLAIMKKAARKSRLQLQRRQPNHAALAALSLSMVHSPVVASPFMRAR